MKKILVLGAGRSSAVLIRYLLEHAGDWNVSVTVGDRDLHHAASKVEGREQGHAIYFDATDDALRRQVVSDHDLVISLLPPHLHILVARECIFSRKNLITASYLNAEMESLQEDVKLAGVLFMYEMGLDPGIDHMSAMKIIHEIRKQGGKITSFKSGTGGLVAPESDDNPWHYKVTWNPRNVVLAGQGTALFLENGMKNFVPYHRLFTSTEKFKLKGLGKFESYPNRDSLQYISKYGLTGVQTIVRSTLRKAGFCEAWNALIQLGLTEDSYVIENANQLSYAEWLSSYLPANGRYRHHAVQATTAAFLGRKKKDEVFRRLEWLGLFTGEKIPLKAATPAQILQDLIERKWKISETDIDMIVMRHETEYLKSNSRGKKKMMRHLSTLVIKGDDAVHTGMAKTVGLPMAIMAKLLLHEQVALKGIHIPVLPEVYEPVLQELSELGVKFDEETREVV